MEVLKPRVSDVVKTTADNYSYLLLCFCTKSAGSRTYNIAAGYTYSPMLYLLFFCYFLCSSPKVLKYRVIQNDCLGVNNLSYTIHLILQMQPHVISFYGVTSRIRFMFLLFPQVSRN